MPIVGAYRANCVNPNSESSYMFVTSRLFEAYLECPAKCWLRSRAEAAVDNGYAEWSRVKTDGYRTEGLERLVAAVPESDHAIAPLLAKNTNDTTSKTVIDLRFMKYGIKRWVARYMIHRQR